MSEWTKVSKYALVRGNQSISKVYVMGCTLYELWIGDKRIGSYNDADEAKEAADAETKEVL